jgi:membrane protein required for colicin V production
MNYIDIAIIGLVLFGAVKGFSKGFIVEAASLIALVLGLVGALLFSTRVGELAGQYIDSNQIPPAGVMFIITFIGIIIGINLLAKFLTKILKLAALGGLNRIFGAFFGALKYVLILSGVALILDQFDFLFTFVEEDIIVDSKFYSPIKNIGSEVLEWVIGKKDLIPNKLV